MPLLKKRTALLGKLKALFRRYRSQPIRALIAKINPILRGWVNYFAVGHSSRVFLVYSRLGGKEDSETSGTRPPAQRLRLEAMESTVDVRNSRTL